MNMRWYKKHLKDVIYIGCDDGNPNLSGTSSLEFTDFGFGTYRGMHVQERSHGVFRSKSDAIRSAKACVEINRRHPFPDGSFPFEIVFFWPSHGWKQMTSSLVRNDHLIQDRMNAVKNA